jgi:hypothetical protein
MKSKLIRFSVLALTLLVMVGGASADTVDNFDDMNLEVSP